MWNWKIYAGSALLSKEFLMWKLTFTRNQRLCYCMCILQQENISLFLGWWIILAQKYIQNFNINFIKFQICFEYSNPAAHMCMHIYEPNNLQINCYICLTSH